MATENPTVQIETEVAILHPRLYLEAVRRPPSMPRLTVPLLHPSHASSIALSYRTHGSGRYAVLLLPGLLVPSSMYDIVAAILSSNPSFTIITLDNRGIGRSDTPPCLARSSGYTALNLALDAWAVVDEVIRMKELFGGVGLVGHSMGGMIAQQMALLRPRRVRFIALLATHAGGIWNLWPSVGLLLGAWRVLTSGFDSAVHADVNLRLHFTDKFLEEVVGGAVELPVQGSGEEEEEEIWEDEDVPTPPPSPKASHSSPDLSRLIVRTSPDELTRTSSGTDLRFLHSKLQNFSREAGLHFNLSPTHLTATLRKQHQTLIRKLRSLTQPHVRRREVYHAQYTAPNEQARGSVFDSALGHIRVVWSHSLPWSFARKLRRCSRIVKLVVLGRHDQVITPTSSRSLAKLIDATTVVEVDAAHFVADECAAEVATQILFGLRTAFFGGRQCDCEWCGDDKEKTSDCRMC